MTDPYKIELTRGTLGKDDMGVRIGGWRDFESWVKANLRLSRPMKITIDRFGEATLEASDE